MDIKREMLEIFETSGDMTHVENYMNIKKSQRQFRRPGDSYQDASRLRDGKSSKAGIIGPSCLMRAETERLGRS